MKEGFYRFLMSLSKLMGQWVFMVTAWCIASGYFLFFPGRVAVSARFYRALFPSRCWLHHLWCAWKQYHHFTHVFLDRFLLPNDQNITFIHEGWEHLDDAVNKKTGGIILMSHVGNWELAAYMLLKIHGPNNPDLKLLLYLGKKYKEQIERTQKESIVRSGVKIIAVEQDEISPADIIEGINFLKSGGLVSLTGDRRWRENQRYVPVRFLGHEAFLPEAPFVFALLSGTPLFIFFVHRTGRQKYHFKTMPPEYVRAGERSDRQEAIRSAAQAYADILEDTVRHYPYEWYHFEPFIGRRLM
jgi:predicted LPLAT superfamily acyltransferase